MAEVKRKRKRGKGNQKGSRFERKMCGIVSLWLSGNKRDDLFWRSAMSGGRATLRNHRRRNRRLVTQVGDMVALGAEGEVLLEVFLMECKHYKTLGLQQMMVSRTATCAPLQMFWWPYYHRARELSRIPLVLAKQNQIPELVFTTKEGYDVLLKGQKAGTTLQPVCVLPRARMYIFWLSEVVRFCNAKVALKAALAPKKIPRPRLD